MEDGNEEQISPLVRRWLPHASKEEVIQATVNFREYVAVLYRIFLRLEAEEYFEKRKSERESD